MNHGFASRLSSCNNVVYYAKLIVGLKVSQSRSRCRLQAGPVESVSAAAQRRHQQALVSVPKRAMKQVLMILVSLIGLHALSIPEVGVLCI